MKPRASALSASSEARRSKKRLAVFMEKTAELEAGVRKQRRQKQIERIKRAFFVWRR